MKQWLLKKLKAVALEEHNRLYTQYVVLLHEFRLTVERHEMQGAWEQVKQERKVNRLH